jgi:hypothetical protein
MTPAPRRRGVTSRAREHASIVSSRARCIANGETGLRIGWRDSRKNPVLASVDETRSR